MTDPFNLSHLAQEMVVSRLKEREDAHQVAAEIAKKTIVAGVNASKAAGQSPQQAVEDICLGVMKGLVLIGKDLPKAAANILLCMSEASHEVQLDPSEMMTWAMRGIAQITPLVTPQMRWNIQNAIEEQFTGTGEVFGKLCDSVGK